MNTVISNAEQSEPIKPNDGREYVIDVAATIKNKVNNKESTKKIDNIGVGIYESRCISYKVSGNAAIGDIPRMCHLLIDISGYAAYYNDDKKDQALSEDMLAALDQTLASCEAADKRLVVRVAYDPGFKGDNYVHEPGYSMIKNHIASIAGKISKHKTCIVAIEAGMLGKRGEMSGGYQCCKKNRNMVITEWEKHLDKDISLVKAPYNSEDKGDTVYMCSDDDSVSLLKESTYIGDDEVYKGLTEYDYINNHSGYRFVVRDVRIKNIDYIIDNSGRNHGEYRIEVDIENVGNAKRAGCKCVEIWIVDDQNHIKRCNLSDVQSGDPSEWESGTMVTYKATVLPIGWSGMEEYRLYMRLTDEERDYNKYWVYSGQFEGDGEGNMICYYRNDNNTTRFANDDTIINGRSLSQFNDRFNINYLCDVDVTYKYVPVIDTKSDRTDENQKYELDDSDYDYTVDQDDTSYEEDEEDDEDDEQDIPDTDFYEPKSPFYAGDTIRKQTKNIDFNAIITSINTDKKKGEIRITKINESNKNLVIADSYTCDGVTFKVTSVLSNAFLHLKSDSITIGKNVKSIKYGELDYSSISTSKVIIKTKKLKAKNVDRNFVKDLPDFVTIVVPKSKYKEYKKLFFKKGLAKTAKVIKG